jgi:hypothetical protein
VTAVASFLLIFFFFFSFFFPCQVIMNSLHCVQGVMIADKRCFELYGYDILLDDTLTPSIIEVRALFIFFSFFFSSQARLTDLNKLSAKLRLFASCRESPGVTHWHHHFKTLLFLVHPIRPLF